MMGGDIHGWWVAVCFIAGVACNREEAALLRHLLADYDVNVRPVDHHTDIIDISMDLDLIQILNMDEKNQILYANYWQEMFWQDVSLHWDPADYGGLETIRLHPHRVWKPDVTLLNDVDIDSRTLAENFLVVVGHTGHVSWIVPVNYHSSCPLDMTYYPWDQQKCSLTFVSWVHSASALHLHNISNSGRTLYFSGHGEWILQDFTVLRRLREYKVEVENNHVSEGYPEITYTLKLKRKPLFSFYHVILPSMFITLCAYIVFLLPPESGEKVSMSVTMLLSTTVFLLLVTEHLPAQSDVVPVIGKYFLAAIGLLVVSTAATVSVLYIHFHGALRLRMSATARKVILQWLATCVLMRNKVDTILRQANTAQANSIRVQPARSGEFNIGDMPVEDCSPAMSVHTLHHKHYSLDPVYIEWVLAAMVMDRLYFCIFVTITVILTAVLMGHHPG